MSDTDPARAAALLESERLMGHLATSHDDRPHVAPLWYVYRDVAAEVRPDGSLAGENDTGEIVASADDTAGTDTRPGEPAAEASEGGAGAAERGRWGVVEVATTGRKLADLRRNPRVALSVQKDVDGSPQWGVVVRGTARVIEDEADAEATLVRVNRKYGTDDHAWSENTPVRIDVGSGRCWEY